MACKWNSTKNINAEKQTQIKIQELIEKNKQLIVSGNNAEIWELVVYELAEFFKVSKTAAKIRMIDLGYLEVKGVHTYIDDRYINNYSFEVNSLQKNQTFTIGIQDALIEYLTNPSFKMLIDSGKYLYVDAHFCINDCKYICLNENGYAELTDYATQHIDECCLIFNIEVSPYTKYGDTHYSDTIMYRSAISNNIVSPKYKEGDQNKSTEERAEKLKEFSKEVHRMNSILRELPATFSDTLVSHMKRKKYTVELLSGKSLIGVKTIQRLRNDDEYDPKIGTLIAICIGLQLEPMLSTDLVKKSACRFKKSQAHTAY